ncbi:unnamed protein product [Calypogeia fissa]
MGVLAVVAPLGRYGNLSKSTCSRPIMCRCCGQSQVCLRVQSSKTRVTKLCSSVRSEQRRLVTSSSRSSRRGVRLCEGGREGSNRSFRKESFKRLATDIVLYAYAHAFDTVQRKEVLSLEADNLSASHDRRSGGGAHSLAEEASRFRHRDGQDGGPFSQWDGQRGVLTSSAVESALQGPGGREMVRNGEDGICHPSDERFRHFRRFSDSWAFQGSSQDGDGVLQDRVLGGESGVLERRGGPGPRSATSRNYSSSQSSLNIPRSELLKIEELRFSGDMQEGDSSPQVLNLQRALFWLGHLPGLSLTGYFGPETTKALEEFNYSNGFSSPGVWGFHSQQLLWKHLFPETHRSHSEMEMLEKSQQEVEKFPEYDLLGSWRFVKRASGRAIGDGWRASATLQRRHSKSFREFVASVSSTLPCRTVVSQRVGVLLLTATLISIIVKLVHFCLGQVHGQPVRKRVMSWRSGFELRRPSKANQLLSNVQKGHHQSCEGGKILRYFHNHRRPKSIENQERSMRNLLDRLVLFEGQVVRGDYLTNGKMRHSTRAESVTDEDTMMNPSDCAVNGSSSPVLSSKQVDQSGFSTLAPKIAHGLDQFQKVEADPARKVFGSSLVKSEKSVLFTGGDQQWSRSSPKPGWASWVRLCFSSFFPNKGRLPFSQRKLSSRRAVVRTTISSLAKSPERVPADVGLHLRSSRFEKGLSAEDESQKWQEENELDLKHRLDELHRTLQSVEQTRVAAMRALAEEKMHNLELEVKIRRQKEAAAALEEEVRVLKDSHDALLASLKKKYSSSAAARAAAALLYQNWDPSDSSARV